MKISRLVGLIFAAVLAIGLMTATAASAVGPLFLPGTLNTFTGKSGAGTLENSAANAINCTSDATTGEITGKSTVGGVMVTFSGCSSTEKEGCSVDSPGAGSGKVLTNALDGELGTVAEKEAKSKVGLLLLPTVGTEFVELLGSCLAVSPIHVTGQVAGEATPINGGLTLKGTLNFVGSKGVQSIKEITVLGAVVKPALKAFSGLVAASETTEETIEYSKDVEVC
jgi:hypothetical protein